MSHKLYNLCLFIALIVLLALSPLVKNFGKTGRNTKILDRDYSRLGKTEIITKIDQDFPLPQSLKFTYENRRFGLNLNKISVKINTTQIASDLLFRRLNRGIIHYITAYLAPKNFPLTFDLDESILRQQIQLIGDQVNRPFIPTEMFIDKFDKIQIKPGEIGKQLDAKALEITILNNLNYYQVTSPIALPVVDLGDLPSKEQIALGAKEAQNLIGKSIVLTGADQNIIINDEILISWYDFDKTYKSTKINEYVISLADSLKKDPVDAVFQFENGKVLEFKPSKKGYSLDSKQLILLLTRHLPGLISNPDKSTNIDLPLIFTEPKTVNSQVNDLGIKELLGKGTSSFKTSASYRNVNVARGSAIVNRVLVAPGDTFSFTRSLGEVISENGFGKAYIIKEGKTVLDVGGGICQVSTTLFRAILNAGLDIIERHAHAYRVGYYEEDMPPGYDATVFSPRPDLQFINDTGHHVLIQSIYDGVNKSLTYEIYGTSDGRQVEISNYRKWGSTPPPPDIYNDDPTLAAGKIVQDEHKVGGLKTAFDWKVTRNGEIIHQQTFSSSYRAWPAVYRRGTGQ